MTQEPTQADNYAKRLQETTGSPVESRVIRLPRDTDALTYLFIKIGDVTAAADAIDALGPILMKAGLRPADAPFVYDVERARILLPATSIEDYDTKHGGGALFKKLDTVKREIAEVIRTAKVKSVAAAKTPNLLQAIGKTNITLNYPGVDKSQYKNTPLVIKDGDFTLPDDVKKAALECAREVRRLCKENGLEPVKTKELALAAKLDGNGQTLTDEEIAAYLLAMNMSQPRIDPDKGVLVTFANRLPASEYLRIPRDPKVVFQMARQILGDAYGVRIEGGVDTKTPDGDKPYLDAVRKSTQTHTGRFR